MYCCLCATSSGVKVVVSLAKQIGTLPTQSGSLGMQINILTPRHTYEPMVV
ncbi:Uncharacterised protein [Mycobacteroides abscessus subsp. abscessus]|nr:Uncharacterised protein [Mycobacteroides abscessus subsp. abscessus]